MRLALLLAIVSVFCIVAPCHARHGSNSNPRIEVQSAPPGGVIKIRVRSPYASVPINLEALSPSGSWFSVDADTTNDVGAANFDLELATTAGLAGQDLSLRATFFVAERSRRTRVASIRIDDEQTEPVSATLSRRELSLVSESLSPIATAFGDVDKDGTPDLIVVGTPRDGGDAIRIYLNDGQGNFEASVAAFQNIESFGPLDVATGDFNADGHVDIIVSTDELSFRNLLLLNDGDGRFSENPSFTGKASSGVRSTSVLVSDFDGDTYDDLFFTAGIASAHDTGKPVEQTNSLYFGNDRGEFIESARFAADENINPPGIYRSAAVGDSDNDGDLDLFLCRSGFNSLLNNDGDGHFEFASDLIPETEESTYGADFNDVDADGDLDIVLANTVFNPLAQVILVNQGGTQEGLVGEFATGRFPFPQAGQSPIRLGLHVFDADADGDADIFFATHELGESEVPDLYINQGGIQRGTAGSYMLDTNHAATAGVYGALASADIDGDGDLELFAPPASVLDPKRFSNVSYFLTSDRFLGIRSPLAFQRGDVNSDQAQDLSDAIAVLSYLFVSGEKPSCLESADINGSGAIDISDAVSLLNHLFLGGESPAAPYPHWGDSNGELSLSCDSVPFWIDA